MKSKILESTTWGARSFAAVALSLAMPCGALAATPTNGGVSQPGAPAANTCVTKVPSALLVTWPLRGDGGGDACEPDGDTARALGTPNVVHAAITADKAELHAADDGIGVTFRATKAAPATFVAKRTASGFAFADDEDRIVVRFEALDGARTIGWLTVAANANGVCRVDGSNIDGEQIDDLHGACSVTVAPKKADLGTKKEPKGPTGCLSEDRSQNRDADVSDGGTVFCGRVVASFTALRRALAVPDLIGQREQDVKVCTAFADRDVDAAHAACATPHLAYAGATQPRYSFQATSGTGSQSGTGSPSASGTSSPASRRVRDASGSSGSGGSSSGSSKGLMYDLHAVFPIGSAARASVAFDGLNVSSILDRLQDNLGAVGGNALFGNGFLSNAFQSGASKLVASDTCDGTKCPSDSYKKLDTGVFDVVDGAFRAGVPTKFANAEIDLKPIDFSTITNVNYGGKLVAAPHDTRLGLAWYRDIDTVATGTALHLDRTFGPLTFGVTHVVANVDPEKDDNVFRVDKGHTANTVLGAALRFGGNRSFEIFERYGVLSRTGQRDRLTVLSWSPTEAVKPIDDAGTTWRPFAAAGYRNIDANYDPLGTNYDQFAGTRSVFATAGYSRIPAKDGSDPDIDLAVTGVRAWDAIQPRYSALSATLTTRLWKGTDDKAASLVLTHTRSTIATSVYARMNPTVPVDDTEGREMLPNDSNSLKVSYVTHGWSFSAGPALTYSPKKCDKDAVPKCSPNRNVQMAYDIHTTEKDNPLFAKLTMDLAPQQQATFAQKAVASNQLDAKAVLRYTRCPRSGGAVRIQPSLTYDSNISQNDGSFTPGHLVEGNVDFGLAAFGKYVLRASYKLVHPQNLADAALAQRALFVGIASDNTSEAFADTCAKLLPRSR
jgi:hypothetical protein